MLIWKRLLKWLAWILGGVLALLVVAYLTLLAVNWRDRPPSQAAIRLAAMYQNRPPVSDGDNAYVYVMGFAAARDVDPRAAGVRRLEWMRNIPDAAQYPLSGDPVPRNESYKAGRSPGAQNISEACRSATRECVAALEGADEVMREWIESEQWLLDRYLVLLRHEGWLETMPYHDRIPQPSYGMVFDGQKLLLVQASILASEKDAAGVRSLLASDARFWRHVLESSDILITKMIAVAALKRSFGVGNLVLRRLPPELAVAGMPLEWTMETTDAERSMMRCLVGEWVWADQFVKQMETPGSWQYPAGVENDASVASKPLGRMMMPMFQSQDLSNRRAEMFIQTVDALNVPLEQYPAALERVRATFDEAGEAMLPIKSIYNPIGELLLLISGPSYISYGARVTDLEGIRRAAVLTTELRSRKVRAEQIPAEVAASRIRVPYTGKPFAWDAEEGAIVFTGLEPSERGRHAFKY